MFGNEPVLRRDAQVLGQQRGNLAGGAALISLDLLDHDLRAADPPRKIGLCQIEPLRRRRTQKPNEVGRSIAPSLRGFPLVVWLLYGSF
jgi:hypothetical protein